MYGTWCKSQFIPEKLTVKMRNNDRQHLGCTWGAPWSRVSTAATAAHGELRRQLHARAHDRYPVLRLRERFASAVGRRITYTRDGEICFAPSYRTQIGAHGVRGRASQFDDSTDELKMILLRSKMIGRLGRFDSGTSSDNNIVE